jgi:hypothetical protein
MDQKYSDMGTPIYTPSMAKKDSARCILGYRQRKLERLQKKLGKSRAAKDKAISLMGALVAGAMVTTAMV